MPMPGVHRGIVLKDELGITPTKLARQIDVPPKRLSQIIAGKQGITGDAALRFGALVWNGPAVLGQPPRAVGHRAGRA